jgi:hypothetical protein
MMKVKYVVYRVLRDTKRHITPVPARAVDWYKRQRQSCGPYLSASIAPMIATAVVVAVAIGGAAYLKQLR